MDTEATDIDEVLDIIGFGYVQLVMLFACSMTAIYVNNELMGISPIMLSIDCEFKLKLFELSMLSIAAFVGLILSSHYVGYKTDKVGRRTMVIYSLLFSLISSILSIITNEYYWLLFWRFMTGFFISGAGINHLTYLTEFTKFSWRPLMVNLMTYIITAGSIYVSLMASLLRPLDRTVLEFSTLSVRVWRFTLLANCVPGALALLLMCLLPETAKFMLSVGEKERAYRTLNRLCVRNRGRDLKSFGVKSITQKNLINRISSYYFLLRIWQDTRAVYHKPYIVPVLQITFILSGFSSVGNGFGLWFTKMRHYLSTEDMILCESINYYAKRNESNHNCFPSVTYNEGMLLSCTAVGCCAFMTCLMLCMSRRLVLTCTAALAALFGCSLNWVNTRTPQLVLKMLFLALSNTSVPLAGSVITDIVPTHLRGKASALCYMVARTCIVCTSLLHGYLMSYFCVVYFNFYIDFLIAVAILSYFLPV